MIRSSGDSRKRRLVTLLSISCIAAFALLGAPVLADPAPPEGDNEMGSQIRKHEGGDPHPTPVVSPRGTVEGIDVSGHQGNVDWKAHWDNGIRFAYIKATEGNDYRSDHFGQQYNGSYDVGMIRGAYHFALPDRSSGAAQANFFVDSGGGWTKDGKTLPGALDIEYNPYGQTCYGMSKEQMADWIKDFSDTYHARTSRYPVIYTSTNWWNRCASGNFATTSPLWVARYSDAPGPLPAGWEAHTIWQYTSTPLDKDLFNGEYDRLQSLATG